MVAAMAFYEKGDEVLIPDPGFVFYKPHAEIFGAKPVPYSLKTENDFCPDIEEIKSLITPKTKAIVVNSPSNPTGGAFGGECVKSISDIANDKSMLVISDEVYDEIVYGAGHHSFLGKAGHVIYLNSFSKTYAMTGWRIGYIVTSTEYADELAKLHYHNVACPATPVQYAAVEALKGPQDRVREMVNEFRARRDIIVKELNSIDGFSCATPKGAFYVFPSYNFDIPDGELALRLLKAGVICVPGASFGKSGAKHLRFSYANSRENIKKGMDIVREATKKL
jgi:aspartate aminotransferase